MKRRVDALDETRTAQIRAESDLQAEFEAHVAHRADDLIAEGMSEHQAHEQARSEFGDADRLKNESRTVRQQARRKLARRSKMDVLRQDIAYFARQLRRSPVFAFSALATLGLGVGAAATIVSVVDAVVLEPLPFADPDRVVFAQMLTPRRQTFPVSEPAFIDWSERASSTVGPATATPSPTASSWVAGSTPSAPTRRFLRSTTAPAC